MAGRAIAVHIVNSFFEAPGGGAIQIRLDISSMFYDPAVSINEGGQVTVYFTPTATPQQVKTAISDAVIQYAADHLPTMTLSPSDILLPDLSRG
jgi:hypothetical protein